MTLGQGIEASSAAEAIKLAYEEREENDEFVTPAVVTAAQGQVCSGDAMIMFNFRPDRAGKSPGPSPTMNSTDLNGKRDRKTLNTSA